MPCPHLQTLVHCEEKRERTREGRRVIRITPHGGREARKSGDRCNASAVRSCSCGRAEDRAGIMEPASHHTACANPTNCSGILLFVFLLLSLVLPCSRNSSTLRGFVLSPKMMMMNVPIFFSFSVFSCLSK